MTKKSRYIGSKMMEIATQVEICPGETAHWYGSRWSRRWRWGRVYDAFARAAAYGMIRAESDGSKTRYYPVPNWRDQYPELSNG